MPLVALALLGAWIIMLWYQMVHYLPARREIVGCSHERGALHAACPDPRLDGRMMALVWRCESCPLQIPLDLSRVGATLEHAEPHALWYRAHAEGER